MGKPVFRPLVAKVTNLLGIITTFIAISTLLGPILIVGLIIVALTIIYIVSLVLLHQKACDGAIRLINAMKGGKKAIP